MWLSEVIWVRFYRKLLFQVVLWSVLPLLAITAISIISISGHQQAERELVADRAARLARVAAYSLADRLEDKIRVLQTLAEAEAVHPNDPADQQQTLEQSRELQLSFDHGTALFDPGGTIVASTAQSQPWVASATVASLREQVQARGAPDLVPLGPENSGGDTIVVIAVPVGGKAVVAGAFSLASLGAGEILQELQIGDRGAGYVVDGEGRVIFRAGGNDGFDGADGLPELIGLRHSESGALFYQGSDELWAFGYAPLPVAGWSVLVRQAWSESVSSMMQFAVLSPALVILAALVSMAALYLIVRYVVRPIHVLGGMAERVAWGDFSAIQRPVEGVQEIRDLHVTLMHMAEQIRRYQASMQNYVAAVTQGQEEERKRLARELHDETAQSLIGLVQRVKLAQRDLGRDPARAAARLEELEQLATAAWQEVRRISQDLRPPYLEQFGLQPALATLVEESASQVGDGLHIALDVQGSVRRLLAETELVLFRIAQEALNNARQHADARQIEVTLAYDLEAVCLQVKDDGRGFAPPDFPGDLTREGHYGLAGMRERALLVGGRLSVDTAPGQGTCVQVTVPCDALDDN